MWKFFQPPQRHETIFIAIFASLLFGTLISFAVGLYRTLSYGTCHPEILNPSEDDVNGILGQFITGEVSNVSSTELLATFANTLSKQHDKCRQKCLDRHNGMWQFGEGEYSGTCHGVGLLPSHCPMFFDGYMCRESTPANQMFEVNCSRVHHLFNHSTQLIQHKCLHNNSWESGWNHTTRVEGKHAALDTSKMLYTCDSHMWTVDNNITFQAFINILSYFIATLMCCISSFVFFKSTQLSNTALVRGHFFVALALSNATWLMCYPWDGDLFEVDLNQGEHLGGDEFCLLRSLFQESTIGLIIFLKLYMRYVCHVWCLIEGIHLYSCICLSLYKNMPIKKYLFAAYGYPLILVASVFTIFWAGLPYDGQVMAIEDKATSYSDCLWWSQEFSCTYVYRVALETITGWSIIVFGFVIRDLFISLRWLDKLPRWMIVSCLRHRLRHQHIESRQPRIILASICCLIPLLGFHLPLTRIRLKDWPRVNMCIEIFDRNYVPFTSVLLSLLYCFTSRRALRVLKRAMPYIIQDKMFERRSLIHNLPKRNNSTISESAVCSVVHFQPPIQSEPTTMSYLPNHRPPVYKTKSIETTKSNVTE